MDQQQSQNNNAVTGGNNNQQGEGSNQQKLTVNENPRANENLENTTIDTNTEESANEIGSEITDGEDA